MSLDVVRGNETGAFDFCLSRAWHVCLEIISTRCRDQGWCFGRLFLGCFSGPHNIRQHHPQMLVVWLFVIGISISFGVEAKTQRSSAAKAEFKRLQPCPATGKPNGPCPGWIIDHVAPLCAGGTDTASNMQWQTVQDAKGKDRKERRLCRSRPG